MDKNTVIGFVLIIAVLIGFSYFNSPSKEEIEQIQKQETAAAAQADKQKKDVAELQAENQKHNADTTFIRNSTKPTLTYLKNEDISIGISSKGGEIGVAVLKDYKDQQKNPLELYNNKDASLNFIFTGKNDNIQTSDLDFTPSNVTDSTVTMTAQSVDGGKIIFDYKLDENYLLHLTVKAESMQKYLLPTSKVMGVEWNEKLKQQERGYKFENQYTALTYKIKDEGTDRLSTAEEDEQSLNEKLDWISFKGQFFGVTLIAKQEFNKAELQSNLEEEGSGYLKNYKAQTETFFDPTGKQPTEFIFYLGPNKFRTLQKVDKIVGVDKDLKLEQLVYLGWPLFRYINRYFTIYAFDWLTNLGLSMGIVLLLITILLRIIVYVPTRKSVLSSAKMRLLKPKLDEIIAKYPNPEDNLKKQQEIMATYSKYGVSPMGGCLPMLIQMPIWIAMFNFIPNAIELRQQSFLWVDDLSTYDPIITFDSPIWLIGDHISAFCLLFCCTNILYSVMSMRMQKDMMVGQQADQMKIMRWMMYLMPVMFFFIFNDYSAGLNYYYFISLLFSALTMWVVRKTINEKKLMEQLEANYKANKENPKKVSGMAARLEALQKRQEELLKQQHRK